ncbi:hypothetical protein [Acetohalobium arabaticum]|uniref:Uncharacterized protein n=1 Tax=Acetohalobium arabaticum (strain ATCC 49924 / DSM 5501 / Z-7288) TaxID=574087 RepID=D9QQ58_ACEAZ|nr:hypothetical protein [Acetohalobium arabaticum]ADL12649.1 hypothetical protein Acear_1127 [Acetohalobium arabaticum DSM 5501]
MVYLREPGYFGHRGNLRVYQPKCIYCEESIYSNERILWTDYGLAHRDCFLEI